MDEQELTKENAKLIFEIGELKKQLSVACHVKYGDADTFDWGILHRIWDLEDSLEKIIEISNWYRNSTDDGMYQISHCAKKALERSRSRGLK